MGRNGKVEYSELKKLKKNIEKLSISKIDELIEICAKELAARLLAKVIERTQPGQYPSGSGKVGGTLRRGWTAGKEQNAKSYANSLQIFRNGKNYTLVVENPIEYASYVEFGHRTRNHKGWVEGKFMLTISEQEIQSIAPRILENKIKKFLEECLNDK